MIAEDHSPKRAAKLREHAEHVPDHPLWTVDSAPMGMIRKTFGCPGDQKSSGSRKIRRRHQRTHQSDWTREQTRLATPAPTRTVRAWVNADARLVPESMFRRRVAWWGLGGAEVEGAGGRFASASEQATRPRPGESSGPHHDGPTPSAYADIEAWTVG